MVELARYGPGKILGELIYVIPKLRSYQPYEIKCISVEGEVLRMSGIEFQIKILKHQRVLDTIHNLSSKSIINN